MDMCMRLLLVTTPICLFSSWSIVACQHEASSSGAYARSQASSSGAYTRSQASSSGAYTRSQASSSGAYARSLLRSEAHTLRKRTKRGLALFRKFQSRRRAILPLLLTTTALSLCVYRGPGQISISVSVSSSLQSRRCRSFAICSSV